MSEKSTTSTRSPSPSARPPSWSMSLPSWRSIFPTPKRPTTALQAESHTARLQGLHRRAAANADVSTKAVIAQGVLAFDKDVNDAAEVLGITPGGVRWACRNGRLGGKKSGRQWLTTDEEIEMYRNTHQRQAVS